MKQPWRMRVITYLKKHYIAETQQKEITENALSCMQIPYEDKCCIFVVLEQIG